MARPSLSFGAAPRLSLLPNSGHTFSVLMPILVMTNLAATRSSRARRIIMVLINIISGVASLGARPILFSVMYVGPVK